MTIFLSQTIIIPTFCRPDFLKSCLDSIFRQIQKIEVIVIVNGFDGDTLELLKTYNVTVLITDGVTPSEARNRGIQIAHGDIIGFLDDDIELCENYFIILDTLLKKYPDSDVIGGPDQTFPMACHWEKGIGLTLTSPLATAKTSYRHLRGEIEISNANEEHLILCNLWIKRDIFKKENFIFDDRLFRNEENVLLFQLVRAKKQLIYSPNLYVYHHRKGNLKSLIKAVSSSGFFRSLSFYYYPAQISFHYMVPSLFVIYHLFLPFITFRIFFVPLVLYMIINIIISLRISFAGKTFNYFFRIVLLQYIINIAYGLGFLYSSLKIFFQCLVNKNFWVKRTRKS